MCPNGIKENEKSPANLMEIVTNKIKEELNIVVENRDINTVYRIGKTATKNEKERPILVTFVNNWMTSDIMRNKKKFINVYASEDYPKEVLEKRKELQPKLEEEREKGNYAFINYDKLIVKEGKQGNEKRKRDESTSPNAIEQPRKQHLTKTNRRNAFDVMRHGKISLNAMPSMQTENIAPERNT